jgi:hypothetical protein
MRAVLLWPPRLYRIGEEAATSVYEFQPGKPASNVYTYALFRDELCKAVESLQHCQHMIGPAESHRGEIQSGLKPVPRRIIANFETLRMHFCQVIGLRGGQWAS